MGRRKAKTVKATRGKRSPGMVRAARLAVLVAVSLVIGGWISARADEWIELLGHWSPNTDADSKRSGLVTWSVYLEDCPQSSTVVITCHSSGSGLAALQDAQALFGSKWFPRGFHLAEDLAPGQSARITFTGWPWRHSFWAETSGRSSAAWPVWSKWGLLWNGAVADTLLFGLSVFGVFIGVRDIADSRRTVRRALAGRCLWCGYDMRGLVGPACPECGAANPMHRARGEVVDQKGSDAGEVRV